MFQYFIPPVIIVISNIFTIKLWDVANWIFFLTEFITTFPILQSGRLKIIVWISIAYNFQTVNNNKTKFITEYGSAVENGITYGINTA
jgi:predicted tellurium resistance membrane protein TerC